MIARRDLLLRQPQTFIGKSLEMRHIQHARLPAIYTSVKTKFHIGIPVPVAPESSTVLLSALYRRVRQKAATFLKC